MGSDPINHIVDVRHTFGDQYADALREQMKIFKDRYCSVDWAKPGFDRTVAVNVRGTGTVGKDGVVTDFKLESVSPITTNR
jgi:hypothetical protein